jgi:hypothetical protein
MSPATLETACLTADVNVTSEQESFQKANLLPQNANLEAM